MVPKRFYHVCMCKSNRKGSSCGTPFWFWGGGPVKPRASFQTTWDLSIYFY